ncbi:MAG: hypothetical protein HYY04_14780 [Chloroflexi bacterium]|nr:hypothetical protein [Chloroflexota bacterium]
MGKTFALVHSTSVVVAPLSEVAREVLPGVEILHYCDDTLLRDVRRAGKLTPAVARRYVHYVTLAEEAAADAVMVTCSSCNRVAELAKPFVTIPVFSIDEAMAEQAVGCGCAIGVVATVPTTLEPTASLIGRKAEHAGRSVEVSTCLASRAFDRLIAGDPAGHDEAILDEVRDLSRRVDVITLAQASMARLQPRLQAEVSVPVLASPRTGFERALAVLGLG